MQTNRRIQFIQQELFPQEVSRPPWQSLPDPVKRQIRNLCVRLIEESRKRRNREALKKGLPMSDKIQAHHLARRAVLYVRQSTGYQVFHNEESRRLQYAMKDWLHQLG